MPRITSYTNGAADESVSYDVCRPCYRDQIEDKHLMIATYGPGYDTDVEHPEYLIGDRCWVCEIQLAAHRDN